MDGQVVGESFANVSGITIPYNYKLLLLMMVVVVVLKMMVMMMMLMMPKYTLAPLTVSFSYFL
jgi:hypothetical protein